MLIDYATENKIILELNEKKDYEFTPIFGAIQNNNIEMFKMLVEYSIEKGIKLRIDENDIENMISVNKKYKLGNLKNFSEINSKLIKLIYFYKNKNIIEVIFSRNSYFLKRFKEFNENKGRENESRNYVILEIENEITEIELEKEKKEKEKIKKENEIMRIELEKEKKEKEKIKKDNDLLRIELEEERRIKVEQENKKLEKKKYLVKKINNKRDNNETLLTSECKQDNIEELKKLIHCRMNINKKNKMEI
jgi:hypothetical protein